MSKKIFCLLFVLALAGRLDAEDGPVEPYVVYVARDGEFARCGPSEDYYKTDPLRAGAEVEVYLETADGWLGIRPPADSFCWLQSDQVEIADDETFGTIIEPSTVAWIGTHLGKARQYRWQVRLDQGEQVTIIGTAQREGPDGQEVWYRIVPPPGEFRWVHEDQISDTLDAVVYNEGSPTRGPENAPATSALARSEEASAAPNKDEDENRPLPIDDSPVGSGVAIRDADVRIRSIAETERPGPPDETSPLEDASGQSGSRVVTASATEPPSDSLQPTAPPQLEPLHPEPLATLPPSGYQPASDLSQANVDGLRLELSHAMAAAAHAAEIEPLRSRAAELADHASDSVVRGRASLLLRRVEEYQRIAQQREGRGTAAGMPSASARAAAAPNPATGPTLPSVAVPAATGEATTFDRRGWLVRVYSARPNAPPYAITDSAGRTLSYVTPVPGINLRRYLNQEIGLYGRVAYDTSLETPHLIAEQAVRLRR